MSNIGKLPVEITETTKIEVNGQDITVTGPKGELFVKMPKGIKIELKDGAAVVKKEHESKELKQYYGLTRALLANAVKGVNEGFEKKLKMEGVGYRAKVDGRELVLNVGFANAIRITPPEGTEITVKKNDIIVSGINKELIGDIAASIRRVRPPEPYKGKGIRYAGEYIRRKAGKTAKSAGE